MKIIDYIGATDLKEKTESERSKLLCFYHLKETNETRFSITTISDLLVQSGFNAPNRSKLKEKLIKRKERAFVKAKGDSAKIEFIPVINQSLEKSYGTLWGDNTTIESSSELIDEEKFCGKRGYLDRLIIQVNHSYDNNCYDATAVLMRRIFEGLILKVSATVLKPLQLL